DEPTNLQNTPVDEKGTARVNDFIDTVTNGMFFDPEDDELDLIEGRTRPPITAQPAIDTTKASTTELSSLIAPELDQEESLFDFPSMTELQSLAQELMTMTRIDPIKVGQTDPSVVINTTDGGTTTIDS